MVKHIGHIGIIFALVMLLILAGCTFDVGGEEISASEILFGSSAFSKTETKNIRIAGQSVLSIPGTKEDVTVTPWDKDYIEVKAFKKIKSSNRDRLEEYSQKIEVPYSISGNEVRVNIKFGEFPWVIVSQYARMEVMVPAAIKTFNITTTSGAINFLNVKNSEKVSLECTSGKIYVHDISAGEYVFRTTSGDITAKGVSGSGEIVSTTGRVKLNDVKGSLNIETSGGSYEIDGYEGCLNADIDMGGVKLQNAIFSGECLLKATSGNISARLDGIGKDSMVKLSNTSGVIEITLPGKTGFDLDASAASGKITMGFNLEDEKFSVLRFVGNLFSRKEAVGKVNGGGPLVQIRTLTGLVKIKKSP